MATVPEPVHISREALDDSILVMLPGLLREAAGRLEAAIAAEEVQDLASGMQFLAQLEPMHRLLAEEREACAKTAVQVAAKYRGQPPVLAITAAIRDRRWP